MNEEIEKYFKEIYEWREWLKVNHSVEKVVWLVYYKKHTNVQSLDYSASVEEALCYGWIDSLVKRIDDDRFMRKFTPRRRGSVWAPSNLLRIKKLLEEGRMKAGGLKTIEGINLDGPGNEDKVRNLTLSRIPACILSGLESRPGALHNFQHLAPSRKKAYIGWVMEAKRKQTREKRLEEMCNLLEKGEKLGMK